MSHNTGWSVKSGGSFSDRIPRLSGAFWFALPFYGDQSVTWANYFGSPDPRAFLVGKYPTGHGKADQVYPLDLDKVASDDADEIANFIGLQVDGENYEINPTRTVTLAGAISLEYVQQIHTGDDAVAPYTVDPAVVAAAPKLGMKIYNGHLFWNTVQ